MPRKKGALDLCIAPVRESPCLNCETRSLRCHSGCEEYEEFRAICEKVAQKRKNNSEVNEYVSEVMKRMPGKRHI